MLDSHQEISYIPSMNLRHESPRHAVINDCNKWLATVNTEERPGLAEAVLKVIEEYEAARAKRNEVQQEKT